MKEFLRQVAEHYVKALSNSGGESLCFIFPNRRSTVFFRKMLAEAYAASGSGSPCVAPELITINDFFAKASSVTVADRISLLLELYDCYCELYPKAEPLDEFIYWGDVLLGDFNDVDKYRVDPSQLFTNVADFKSMSDDFSYLSANQRKAIESFLAHFAAQGVAEEGASSGSEASSGVKETFRQIWNILLPLYQSFNSRLRDSGRAYEGMVYRSLADRMESPDESCPQLLRHRFPHADKFVFVGLNALNECEKTVLGSMRDCGIAEFCWDYSGEMIRDPRNKSSFFMGENVRTFPQAFELDPEGVSLPEFNVVSVPSAVGQVKQLAGIIGDSNPDDCAVVLPDETLLVPLLNSIPSGIASVNVTMGYPMSSSEFFAFMHSVHQMQLNLRFKGGEWCFYHKYVWDIFASGIFRGIIAADGNLAEKTDAIRRERKYYIPQSDLTGAGLPAELFTVAVDSPSGCQPEGGREAVEQFSAYLCRLASWLGPRLGFALETDFAREYYTSVRRLSSKGLDVRLQTFVRLLESTLSAVSVPFNGEPLAGLQIMGPLETRALDFKTVIILSANEGVFPGRNVSSSFIPPQLRKGFGLPTYEYQDAVWAYYFYRMISRAEKVWMLYDSRTEGMSSGEESRYIKQLRYHFGVDIRNHVAKSSISGAPASPDFIEKTAEDLNSIYDMRLSPSSVLAYVDCPVKFYYQKILKLSREDEVSESMDNGMIGTVYHDTMRDLLMGESEMLELRPFDKLDRNNRTKGQDYVSRSYLREWSRREEVIRKKVISHICAQLHTDELAGRDVVMANVIVRYVLKTIERELEMMEASDMALYEVVGLEMPMEWRCGDLVFFGIVDRVDRFGKAGLRLVDYKTGRDNPDALVPAPGKESSYVDSIFNASDSKHAERKAALQFYIYDRMLESHYGLGAGAVSNSMYSTTDIFRQAPQISAFSDSFRNLVQSRLEELLAEMTDPGVPFTRTCDVRLCEYCDFRMICGR